MAAIQRHQERLIEEFGQQQVTVLSEPEGATVIVDGKPVGVTPWTYDLPPGKHDLLLRREGYADARHTFTLPADQAIDVALNLAVAAEAPAPVPVNPLPAPEAPLATVRDNEPGAMFYAGIGLAALGLVGVGTSIGLEVARAGAESDAESAITQLDAEGLLDDRDAYQTGARIAVIAGAALAVGGITLIVIDRAGASSGDTVALSCGPWNCSVRGSF
jgi:hypothetical protein